MAVATKRNLSIDAIKAFAIVCVVLGHCIQCGSGSCILSNSLYFDDWLFRVIYSFHMPLFMLVSGFLFAHSMPSRPWYAVIVRKFKSLVIPMACWSLLTVLIAFVCNLLDCSMSSLSTLFVKFISSFLYLLWFLWAIFWSSMCVAIVNRFCNDNPWVYLFVFILTFFIPDVFHLTSCKYMYPYFVLGYQFSKCRDDALAPVIQRRLLYASLILYIVLMLFYSRESFIYTTGYTIIRNGMVDFKQLAIDVYRFLVGMAGSVLIILLFQYKELYRSSAINAVLSYIGRNTLGIYIISELIFKYIFPELTLDFKTCPFYVTIIECIIVLVVSLLINEFIKKTSLTRKLLLGKNG